MKDVVLLTGAGQIGMAIARRIGYGKKIIIGDKSLVNAENISKIMTEAGYDVEYYDVTYPVVNQSKI
jgi:saccharopine dehydrogenase-like NADP-dependent oxidoreductase